MLLGLPKEPEEAAKALRYIQSQPDITVGGNRPCLNPLSAFWAEYGTLLLEGTRDTLIMTGGLHPLRPMSSACPWGFS